MSSFTQAVYTGQMAPPRPREVPVAKPSAAQIYAPKALLRDDRDGKARDRGGWMPNERRPGASKHLKSTHRKDIMKTRVDTNEYSSATEVEKLQALEEEVAETELELKRFVHEFYVSAAAFTTQVDAQKALLTRLRSMKKISTRGHAQ